MVRNIVALIAGYFVFVIATAILFFLTKANPALPAGFQLLIISSAAGVTGALLGGYLCASIMKNSSWPLITFSILLVVIPVISIIAQPDKAYWSQYLTIFLFAPMVYAGGMLKLKFKKNV